MSKIWKVETNEIGSIEPFASEYQIEAFLMNNPALLGCGSYEEEASPFLLQQVRTNRKERGGRIDLVGLVIDAGREPILKIFELKNQSVSSRDIQQLADYLGDWTKPGSGMEMVRQSLHGTGLDHARIELILKAPKGVSIGPSFEPEAIIAARREGFEAIRIARFRARSSEFYVIVEDIVGTPTTHRNLSWREYGVTENDVLFFELPKPRGRLSARPNPEKLDARIREVIFDADSVAKLLQNRNSLLEFVRQHYPGEEPFFDNLLNKLADQPQAAIALTPATGLASFLAAKRLSYWAAPGARWTLQRTGKKIGYR
jgi:hypothetical protein